MRRWDSWYRFTTLALAVLAICADADAATSSEQDDPGDRDVIGLTVNLGLEAPEVPIT